MRLCAKRVTYLACSRLGFAARNSRETKKSLLARGLRLPSDGQTKQKERGVKTKMLHYVAKFFPTSVPVLATQPASRPLFSRFSPPL